MVTMIKLMAHLTWQITPKTKDKTIQKKTDFYKDDPATIMDEDPFNTDQTIKSESEISNQNLSVKFRMPLATAALIASIERLNTTTNHLPSKNRHQTKKYFKEYLKAQRSYQPPSYSVNQHRLQTRDI